MTDFTIHTPDTAPAGSKPLLDKLQKAIGFVPGLYGVLAEAPKAVEAYDLLATLFKGTSLTTNEQHVVLLPSITRITAATVCQRTRVLRSSIRFRTT